MRRSILAFAVGFAAGIAAIIALFAAGYLASTDADNPGPLSG